MSNSTPVRPAVPAEAGNPCAPRPLRRRAVLSAAAAALAIWVIAVPIGGVELAVRAGAGVQQVGPVTVVVAAVVAAVAGLGLLAMLERRTGNARTIWTVIAVAALLVSLAGPLGAVSPKAMAVLMAMHVAVGSLVIVTGRCIAAQGPGRQE